MVGWRIFSRKSPASQKVTTGRFEVERNRNVAYLEYSMTGSVLGLITEVPAELRGLGLASSLAETAIIGADYHLGFQQIVLVDTETGELNELRLGHREEAEKFYRDLAVQGMKVRVGMEASGQARWFERLLAELNFELVARAQQPDLCALNSDDRASAQLACVTAKVSEASILRRRGQSRGPHRTFTAFTRKPFGFPNTCALLTTKTFT